MDATVQGIFGRWYDAYRAQHGVSLSQHKAAVALMKCRTEAMGGHELTCPNDDYQTKCYHSCRHRSCPRCQGGANHHWLEKMKSRLLACPHYHVVFTLPHELNALWSYNRQWCQDRLMRSATETLRQLLSDERFLSAEPGMVAALHTWGRTLSFHPHVHVLVTGGGMTGVQWRAARQDYLVPAEVLKAKFRGKWMHWLSHAYEAGELRLPPDWSEGYWLRLRKGLWRRKWNVRIETQYRHGRGVAVYLSRYVKGGPIKDTRILNANSRHIRFQYQDHRDGRHKLMSLAPGRFINRVLWHVPVPGRHVVRYYGLYAQKADRGYRRARALLGAEAVPAQDEPAREAAQPRCPVCGHRLQWVKTMGSNRNSIVRSGLVQPDVEVDARTRIERHRGVTGPPRSFLRSARAT